MNEGTGIQAIEKKDERTIHIVWTDAKESDIDVVDLRRRCPCAHCIDEFTRKQVLKPEDIPETVRPVSIQSVGRYAIAVHFSDGHKTGIYTFTMLRSLA